MVFSSINYWLLTPIIKNFHRVIFIYENNSLLKQLNSMCYLIIDVKWIKYTCIFHTPRLTIMS